jgi:hypothetical protein
LPDDEGDLCRRRDQGAETGMPGAQGKQTTERVGYKYPAEVWGVCPSPTLVTSTVFLGVPEEPEDDALRAPFRLWDRPC